MVSGYIQVHRKMASSLVFQDPYYLKLWLWLLFRARYQPGEVLVGNQVIQLEIGQLIWGRESATLELNHGLRGKNKRSISTWESYLKNLEKLGNLHRQPNNKFTIITIENYAFYQLLDPESQLQVYPQHNSNPTTNKPQTNTKNKDNKDNKDNNSLLIYKTIESQFGRMLSPIEHETISHWLGTDHYQVEVIELAVSEAIRNRAYSLKYVDKILLSWERQDIVTAEQANRYLNLRQSQVAKQPEIAPEELPKVPLYNWLKPDEEEKS